MVAWGSLLRGWTALDLAIKWIPFGIIATLATSLAAFLIPRLAAQWILALGCASVLGSCILLSTMPEKQSYWAQVFPAIALSSLCPDLVYTAAQIIASNSVSRRNQGVAGSLIGTLNLYGNSLGLGFAGVVETQVVKTSGSNVLGYRAALGFGAGISALALVLDMVFVRVAKDEREGWIDDEDRDDQDISLVATAREQPAAAEQTAAASRYTS